MKPTHVLITLATLVGTISAQSGSGSVGVARGERETCVRTDPTELEWRNNFGFDRGVRATGESLVIFHENGDVRFRTHFRATGEPDYKVAVACALRDDEGKVFHIHRKAEIWGSLAAGRPREHTVDETKRHQDIQKNWKRIVHGNRKLHCNARVNVDERAMLDEMVGVLKQYGPVGQVVTIIL
jgi:hypothetical protein